MTQADLIVHGGVIHTLDPRHPSPEAIAIRGGRVQALGKRDELSGLQGPATRVVHLEGQALLPGFNDAHVHVWKQGHLMIDLLNLSEVRSIGELRAKVAEHARALAPGAWLLGRGYNEALLRERRKPTRADLDDLTPHNPVCLTRTCAHIHTVNTVALKLAGITRHTPDPPGGAIVRDGLGEPIGVLLETAYGLIQRVIPPFSTEQLQRFIVAGGRHLLSLGVTSATDPAVDAPLYAAYRALEAEGALPLRVNLLYLRRPDGSQTTLPLPDKVQSDLLRCDGVKFFADGGLSGATAKLREPYRNTEVPTTGVLRFAFEELFELALEAHGAGFRIGTHAIGDVAIEQVLKVYEALFHRLPRPGLRHRLEHCGLPSTEQLVLAAKLGVIAVPQAIFIRELAENFRRYLPERYLPRCYPLRAMLEAGVTVALSSDGPVVRNLAPLAGIHAAVTRYDRQGEAFFAEQAITVAEAIHAYTLGGAIAQGDEENRGSLSPGKWADMVVLSGDPLATPPEALLALEVKATYLAGHVVYTAP